MQHSHPLLFPHFINLPFVGLFHVSSLAMFQMDFSFFFFSMCTLNQLKSVFRSPVCCDHDKKWSLNLKKGDEKQSTLGAFSVSYSAVLSCVRDSAL